MPRHVIQVLGIYKSCPQFGQAPTIICKHFFNRLVSRWGIVKAQYENNVSVVSAVSHGHLRKDQDGSTVIVTPRFNVRIGEKEDGQDDCNHVPSWKDECKGIDDLANFSRIVHGRKRDHGWDLQ